MLGRATALLILIVLSAVPHVCLANECGGLIEQFSAASEYIGPKNFAFQLQIDDKETHFVLFMAHPVDLKPQIKKANWVLLERGSSPDIYCVLGRGEQIEPVSDAHKWLPFGKYGMPGSGYSRCAPKVVGGWLPGSADIRWWANKELGSSVVFGLTKANQGAEFDFLTAADNTGAWVLIKHSNDESCYYSRGKTSDIRSDVDLKKKRS